LAKAGSKAVGAAKGALSAALPEVGLALQTFGSGAGHAISEGLKQPIYSDVKTETYYDKKTKRTVTHTHGGSVSVGLLAAAFIGFAAWEVGTDIAKALSGWNGGANVIKSAEDLLNPGAWNVYTIVGGVVLGPTGALIGQLSGAPSITSQVVSDVQTIANWLSGQSSKSASTPPTPMPTVQSPVQQYAKPSTPMASFANLVQGILDPVSAEVNQLGTEALYAAQGGALTIPPPSGGSGYQGPGPGTPGNSAPGPGTIAYYVTAGPCATGYTLMQAVLSNGQPGALMCVLNSSVAAYLAAGATLVNSGAGGGSGYVYPHSNRGFGQ